MMLASGLVAALIAALAWRPATKSMRGQRPRWLVLPLPMILAGVLAWAMANLFVGGAATVALSTWAAASAWLVLIDLAERRLPWSLTLATTAALVVLLGVQALIDHSAVAWVRAVLAALVVTTGLFVLAWWSGGRLGLGDVALGLPIAVLLGWLGWRFVMYGVAMGFALGGLVALIALISGQGRRGEFPFGPCMVAGVIVGAWLGVAA